MEGERAIWSLRIDEAEDLAALERMDTDLRALGADWVGAMRFKIGARRVALKRRPSNAAAFAAAYGLPAPAGLPLHRYRLNDEAFARLGADLRAAGGYDALDAGARPGLFVLWAAEWFRRAYRGRGHRWVDLTDTLGLVEDQGRLRRLTEVGLKRWGRPVVRLAHGREYLASLAREGGFPVAAVEAGGRGWARDMLTALVAPLLADAGSGPAQAEALARARRDRLPLTHRDDEFLLLCADLAVAVVAIRREADAPARAAGLPVALWLNQHRPGWRDELPLTMSGAGAEALLGDLLTVEAATVGGAGVRAERLLVRGPDGRWAEALRLSLDGPVDGEAMRGIGADQGRLRVFAAGELARALPGELAMLDPPGDGESGWMARSSKRAQGEKPVAFGIAIECDLRSGGQRVTRVTLPGGKPRRGRMLVCTIAKGDADAPTALKVEGSGSGLFTAETVVLQAPADWRVEPSEGETVRALGDGVEGAALWVVQGGALVTDDRGDGYRIRTGQARDRRDRIEIDDHPVRWATTAGDVDLFAGPPAVRPGDRTRGALFIRPFGVRAGWRPAPSPLPVGHFELGWREGTLLLDRRRLAVVPADATIACAGRGREARWMLAGWEGATMVPASEAPVRADGATWHARPTARAAYRFDAEVHWPDAPPLPVRIAFPQNAAIARWDGALLPPDTVVTLAELRDLVTVDGGRMEMFGELVEAGGRGDSAVMRWDFDGELPLSSAAADIASMLSPAGNDAKVRLGMLDGVEAYWDVRPFAVRLQRTGGALAAVQGVIAPDVEVCGRAFADPAHEVSFGPYSLLADANHRPFGLPPGSRGDWMVYLRDGATVLSRPEILAGDLPAATPDTPLARAMATPPWDGLTAAVTAVMVDAGRDGPAGERTVEALVALTCSLHGLPPSSFEALRLLPGHPDVLARMVLATTAEQRDAVLALSDALPFAWCIIPKRCWDAAGERQYERLLDALGPIEGAFDYATQAMVERIARIAEREPLLGPVLKAARGPSRMEAAQVFTRRVIDGRAARNAAGSRWRERGLALPADHLNLPGQLLEWLDAPCAAALAVTGAWTPRPDDVRHLKTVARNFPTFFADAFAARLQELR
jgi:hypothetical protein